MKKRKCLPKKKTGGAIGTLVGAGVGSFVPGLGTSMGATLGGTVGSLFGGRKEPKPLTPQSYAAAHTGYKRGGKLKKGKKYPYGGTIQPGAQAQQVPLGQGAARYEGPSHEQGGIPVGETGRPNQTNPVAEVEGGETSQRMGDETFIFSDELMVPGTEMTFAEAHEILIEEGAGEEEIEELKQVQEQVRQQVEGGEMQEPQQQAMPDAQAQWGQEGMFRLGGDLGAGKQYRDQQVSEFRGGQKSDMVFREKQRLLQYKLGGSLRRMPTGGTLRKNAAGRFVDSRGRFIPAGEATRYNVSNPDMTRLNRAMAPNNPEAAQALQRQNVFGQSRPFNTQSASRGQRAIHQVGRALKSPVGRFGRASIPGIVIAGGAGALYDAYNRGQQWKETGVHPNEKSVIQTAHRQGQTSSATPTGEFASMFDHTPFHATRETAGIEPVTMQKQEEINEIASASPAPIVSSPSVNIPSVRPRSGWESQNRVEGRMIARKGGKLPKYPRGAILDRTRPDFGRTVGSGTTDRVDYSKFAGNKKFGMPAGAGKALAVAGFAAPALTNLYLARTSPKPESIGRMSQRQLPVTSPIFNQARGQMRAGYRTAMDGGAPKGLAHSQYLQGMSEMAAQEAQFRGGQKRENLKLASDTEAANLQLRGRDLEATAMDRAARTRLVTDAFEGPSSAFFGHRRNMQLAGAHISDEAERERFMERNKGLFGFRKGGKLSRAFKRSNRINYPVRK